MTNVNLAVTQIATLGGATSAGWKIGVINSAAKAAQNDTWTLTNVDEVVVILANLDSTGVIDACTISANVVTLTINQTGATSAFLVYR